MTKGQLTKAKMTDEEEKEATEKEEVGVVPLGIPLFAGPGAITTVMIYVSYALDSPDATFELRASYSSASFATVIISFFLLRYADPMFNRMGKSGTMAFTRIMGLLLAAMAVEFILSGTLRGGIRTIGASE